MSDSRPRWLWQLASCFSLTVVFTAHLGAQAVAGSGADARQLPRGAFRTGIGGQWDGFSRVSSDSGSRPLLAGLATASLGVRAMPQLGAAEAAIRELSGTRGFALSLGPLEADGDARYTITPFTFEYGVTRKLSIGLIVPYVESRNNALLILNRDGTGASVGQNPARSTSLGASAKASNGALLRQLAQARQLLSAEAARCANATAANCDAIRANPSAVQQLIDNARVTQNALALVYGDSVRGGSPLVPIAGSPTQVAINARVTALRTGFAGYGVPTIEATALPSAAIVVNGPGAVPRIARDSAYGLDYDVLGGTRRAGIGDVDLTMSYQLLNTLGDRPAQWLAARTLGVRSQLTVGWRFGTAGADRTNTAFDVPIGDGANALLVRSTTDLLLNKRFWMSSTLRVVQPFADQAVLRRPLFVDSLLFTPSSVGVATRTLGRHVQVELAPRLVFGQFFGLSAGYVLQHVGASTFAFDARDALPATTLTIGSRTSHAVVVGATFSTLSAYTRGRSRWPIEASYSHTAPVSTSGDRTPVLSSDRLELRVYTGFPRR